MFFPTSDNHDHDDKSNTTTTTTTTTTKKQPTNNQPINNKQPTTTNQQQPTNNDQPTTTNQQQHDWATSMCCRVTLRLKTCQQHPQSTNVCLWVSTTGADWICRTCHLRCFQSPRQQWRMRTKSSCLERQCGSSCTRTTRWRTDHTFDIPYFQGVSTARSKWTLVVTVTLAVKFCQYVWKETTNQKQSARCWLVQGLCGKSQPLLIHPISNQIPGAIG